MTTYYNMVFDQKQYQGVSAKAANYFQERAKSEAIPLEQTASDMLEYRHLDLLQSSGTYASLDYEEKGVFQDTIHEYTDIQLFTQMCHLKINKSDVQKFGSQMIADKHAQEIQQWTMDVDWSIFHGPENFSGVQLAEGVIGQLTSIEDLAGGASDLTTKGYIWKAIIKMMNAIPFRYREVNPDMVLMVTSNLWEKLISPDRVYTGGMTELAFITEYLMGAKARPGFKIADIIVTDKILCEASDDTDGANADTADTQGTNDRMFLFIPNKDIIARVTSRSFGLAGEGRSDLGDVRQHYAWRGRGYVFDSSGAVFTESITWS